MAVTNASPQAGRLPDPSTLVDVDRLAGMLPRVDPHHLLEMILSHAQKQPEAGRALDQPHAEGWA